MDQAHAGALLAGERARLERLLAAESQEPDAADLGDELLGTRFGIYAGGVASMKDPRYTVVPQRERLDQGRPARADDT